MRGFDIVRPITGVASRALRLAQAGGPATAPAALAAALLCIVTLAPAAGAATGGSGPAVDPRVWAALDASRGAPVPIWVEFRDKGERDAVDLAARLAEAEAQLTPRNRARRLRAHVSPLVDERDLPVYAPYLDALRGIGLEPYGVSRWFNHAAVRADAASLARIEALPVVRGIRPVERARLAPLPVPSGESPARRASPFGLGQPQPSIDYARTLDLVNQIQAGAVHDSGYIGTGVLICVLDAGFNGWNTHQALAGIDVPPGHVRDFVQGDFDVTGGFTFDHGGWVLGCMAANRPGDYVGTGFGASYALARTEDASSETAAEMVYWAQGAEWADSLGAEVINSSLGYNRFDNPADNLLLSDLDGMTSICSRAAEIAASKGILVVNSAGNEGSDPTWRKINVPADVNGDSLIAAGAVDLFGSRASFSSMGPTADGRIKPDLMADGVNVPLLSTSNPAGYTSGSGTSFSSPILAGLAACMLQARPSWSAVDVIRALRQTADRWLSPDTLYGYGVPNGLSALRWPASVATVPPPVGFPQITLIGPNPLRSDGVPTRVRFALNKDAYGPEQGEVRVLDTQGRTVRRLWSGTLECGQWITVSWDGRTGEGARAGAGMYFIALDAAGYQRSVRVAWLP